MAHFTCLAAARHHLLAAAGWDVERDGLGGAPPIRVVAGANRHATLDRALRFLGIGTAAIREVPADDQGRVLMDALRDELGRADGPTIVCVQAGDINTGAFDDLEAAADAAAAAGAWLHVDGAIGLWAAASPSLRHLVAGVERADSWATDAHKLLNVPYDSGIALLRSPGSPPGRPRRPIRVPRARRRGVPREIRSTSPPSTRGARAGSRSTRRSARSAAPESRISSSAAAPGRARSPRASPGSRDAKS